MCFYNSQSKRALALAKRYGRKTDLFEIVQEIIDEQYKISAFTHPDCAIITQDSNLQVAKWGLIPNWIKTEEEAFKIRKMTLNAKSETVFNLPSFRASIANRRCLIPSTGYFEFHHEGKQAIPYYLFLKDSPIFSLGGIYSVWQNPVTKDVLQTFSVLTVPANELCSTIHNGGKNPFRMPLIIPQINEERWLDASLTQASVNDFFVPFASEKMDAYEISRDFLKKGAKDATVVERVA